MTVEDSLTAERIRELLHYEPLTGAFTWRVSRGCRPAGTTTGCIDTHGHRLIGVDKKIYRTARLAWLYMTGNWPKNEIDHENRVKGDDRFSNLRDSTHKQNMENLGLKADNTSGVRGVYWSKVTKKWHARINHNNICINLGHFVNLTDAAEARRLAEDKYFTHSGVKRSETPKQFQP